MDTQAKSTVQPDSTVQQAANQLQVTVPTIYARISEGVLHAYKVGRSTRITRESIEQLRQGRGAN